MVSRFSMWIKFQDLGTAIGCRSTLRPNLAIFTYTLVSWTSITSHNALPASSFAWVTETVAASLLTGTTLSKIKKDTTAVQN